MNDEQLKANLQQLHALETAAYPKDVLLTWEMSFDALMATALVAEVLSELHRRRMSLRVFDAGLAVSIFRDKSTRTRFSFASAANALGLAVVDLDEEKSQIAHGETVRETAVVVSFLTEVIGIRDDLFLGEGNRYMREVAAAVEEGYREGVLHRRPALVNLQCDLDHPTQSVSDLLHLKAHFGSFEALRGKRLAMSWAYSPSYGKPLSVPQGLIALMTRFGMDVVLAHPDGYDLVPEILDVATTNAPQSGGQFSRASSMAQAFAGADAVYPKSWAPFEVMKQRTALLKSKDKSGLVALEREALSRNARFRDWECDEKMMAQTRGGRAPYMHCLPADISGVSCERGEVSAAVFEQHRLATYREAGFKPFVIAAMIWLATRPDPAGELEQLVRRRSA